MKKKDDKGNQSSVEILFRRADDKAIKIVLPGLLEPDVYSIV